MRMSEKKMIELHEILESWFIKNEIDKSSICAFLIETLIGTMAIYGFDEDFFDSTVDLMKIRFKNHLKRNKT